MNSTAFSGLKKVEFLFLPAGVQTLQSDAFNGLEQVIDYSSNQLFSTLQDEYSINL